jgi:hypothetical protein
MIQRKRRKPKEVKIMGSPYKILFLDNLKNSKGDELFGETDLTARVIKINLNGASDHQLKETLFHEIHHAILEDCMEIGSVKMIKEIREEAVIRHLSPRMFQTMKDNPKVKHYIFD